jgi:HAE1 family hydrophobic/amphiphilic exporter-1
VRNNKGEAVPLSALTSIRNISGPEFTMRYNLYRSAQINASAAPGYSSVQVMRALEGSFRRDDAKRNGLRLLGHVVPGAKGAAGHLAGSSLVSRCSASS